MDSYKYIWGIRPPLIASFTTNVVNRFVPPHFPRGSAVLNDKLDEQRVEEEMCARCKSGRITKVLWLTRSCDLLKIWDPRLTMENNSAV